MADSKLYERGKVAVGAGELQDCTDVKWTLTRNAKNKHVLAQPQPSGHVFGVSDGNFTLTIIVREDGSDRDWVGALIDGTPQTLRFKDSNGTTIFSGVTSTVDATYTLDDAVAYTVSGVGWKA